LCHVVLLCLRDEKAHAKTCQIATFSCFCTAAFRTATRKYIPCVAFSAICRILTWRSERSPCENPTKSPFDGFFLRGDLSRFSPENTFIRHGINRYSKTDIQAWTKDKYMNIKMITRIDKTITIACICSIYGHIRFNILISCSCLNIISDISFTIFVILTTIYYINIYTHTHINRKHVRTY